MDSISQKLKEYLESNKELSGPGGKFTGNDFLRLTEVLNGTKKNFVIFDNAGGKPFDIIFFDNEINTKSIKKFIENLKVYIFMYQIDGKENIVKDLPGMKITKINNFCQCEKPWGISGFCAICTKRVDVDSRQKEFS